MEQHHGHAMSPRERIMHAAMLLVSEHGLNGVSMTELAKAAGVSRQTLYNHYSDVGSVVADAIASHDAESLQQLTRSIAMCPTPRDAVVQLVHHFAGLGAQGHHYELEHGLSAEAQQTLATYEAAVRDLLRDTLIKGAESGDFRADLDPTTDTYLLYSLLNGITQAVAKDPANANTIVSASTRTILAALGNRD